MKKVLIKPLWPSGLQNRMFETEYPRPLQLWRKAAEQEGYELATWDTHPIRDADGVWVMDLPAKRKELLRVRGQMKAGAPLVLHIVESPIFREKFVRENWRHFDYVVTYENVGLSNTFGYRLPVTFIPPRSGPSYSQRRCAVMINRNQMTGYFAARQQGITGLPGVGRLFTGWQLPRGYLARPSRGCLYGWRRRLAREVESIDPALLTIVGPGWTGERLSWCPLYPRRPFACAEMGSIHRDDKFDIIAGYRFGISVENFAGGLGYISEKIFDTLLAGAVPVYLGDDGICDIVPREAMVDARDFGNMRDLVVYLRDCPKHEWDSMHEAGQAFLSTAEAWEFSDEAFVSRMMTILRSII